MVTQGNIYKDMENLPYEISSEPSGLSSKTRMGKHIIGMCPTCYHLFQFEIEGREINVTSSEWGTHPVLYPRIVVHCRDCGYNGEVSLIDRDIADVVAALNYVGYLTTKTVRQGRIRDGKRISIIIKFDEPYDFPSIPKGWEYSGQVLSTCYTDEDTYRALLLNISTWARYLRSRVRGRVNQW